VTLPSDPLEALNWAWNHSGHAWWVIAAIAAGVGWTSKRLRDWNRRNTLVTAPSSAAAATPIRAAAAASTYAAAPSYTAAGYTAQPAYAAPPQHAPSRKLHREGAPAQRAPAPVARSVDVPPAAASGRWTLTGAFGDPAHARTAIIVAEVLGPPVARR
jgi:hypothetical protein